MFSIIIPLYNKEKTIKRTIQSVLNQTYTDFELLIIDDGSTDNSLEAVSSISDSRIKVYSKKNEGVSSARNFGLSKANFHLIALLDADDFWCNTYLSEMHHIVTDNIFYNVFACNYNINLGSERYYIPKFNISGQVSIIPVDKYCQYSKNDTILTSSSVIFNKKVIDVVGFFDTNLTHGEDLDYWIRLSQYFEIVFLNKVQVTYNYDAPNRSVCKVPEFQQLIVSKYNLIGDFDRDKFISKSAYRFAIFFLINGNTKDALLCAKRIRKYSVFYYKLMLFKLVPFSLKSLLFNLYMKLFNHNVQ